MQRGLLLVVVLLGLAVGCAEADETAEPSESSTDKATDAETVDLDVLTHRALATQERVLGFAKSAGQWQDLPKPVRQAYNRLASATDNGVISPKEYETAMVNLQVLQQAIRSGQLQKVVAREKAKRKREQTSSSGEGSNCMSGYSPCLPVTADLDCADVVAMGKAPVRVRGSDPYGLDGDNDGVGCE